MAYNRLALRSVLAAAIAAVLLAFASPASAQTFGARVGVSSEPDQFYFGAHVETNPVVDRLRFRPNIELGVGNDVTLTTFNFEFAYHFPPVRNGWNFYAGGGPALNIYRAHSDSDAEGGFNIVLGAQHRDGLFVEIKAGAIDSPNFKLGVGYVFGR